MKLNPRDKPILITLGALVFALVLNALVSSADNPNQKGADSKNKDPHEILKLVLEALEATATVGIAGYAVLQYGASERSSERQLRAYVWVRAIRIDNFVVGQKPRFTLEIHNSGQTPAYDLQVSRTVSVGAYPLPEGAVFPVLSPLTGPFVLHPGTSPPFTFHATMAEELTQASNDLMVQFPEQIRLYAFAYIKYLDAFDVERETWFCTSVLREGNDPTNFEAGNRHNRAT